MRVKTRLEIDIRGKTRFGVHGSIKPRHLLAASISSNDFNKILLTPDDLDDPTFPLMRAMFRSQRYLAVFFFFFSFSTMKLSIFRSTAKTSRKVFLPTTLDVGNAIHETNWETNWNVDRLIGTSLTIRADSRSFCSCCRSSTSCSISPSRDLGWAPSYCRAASTESSSCYPAVSASCHDSPVAGSAWARLPEARPHCAGYRWTSRWICTPSTPPTAYPLWKKTNGDSVTGLLWIFIIHPEKFYRKQFS